MGVDLGSVELYAGPTILGGPDDLEEIICGFIRGAKRTLLIVVQELDSRPVAEAVLAAKSARVRVRVILEGGYLVTDPPAQDPWAATGDYEENRVIHAALLRAGVDVITDLNQAIFHQKFMVRDPGLPSRTGCGGSCTSSTRASTPSRGSSDSMRGLDRVRDLVAALPVTTETATVIRIALEQFGDIRQLTVRARELEKELVLLVQQAPQLLDLPGCGVLTAAELIGETANPSRFRSEACFAMHAGVAPIPASSGRTQRHRLARGGNRQLNAALHRIAVTQARLDCPGRDYYQRRKTEHQDSTMEVLRVMKRKIARIVYQLLNTPTTTAAACQPVAA